MPKALAMLLLEDNPNDAELEITLLKEAGYECRWDRVETRQEFLSHLEGGNYDLILADYNLPTFDGLTALKLYRQCGLDLPFILISGTIGETAAIESLKSGATDYVLKDQLSRLVPVVRRALQENEDHRRRKRAEEALRHSEEKYRTLFEESRDAIYITSREGRLLDCNRAAQDLFGYTRQEMIGSDVGRLYVNPDDRIKFQREIAERGAVRDFEVRLHKKDGRPMDCLITSSVRRTDEQGISGYQGIIRDITRGKQLEAQLRQAQKMEALGTLAGGIAHDFNNILGAIIGFTELALLDVPRDSRTHRFLDQVLNAGKRAAALVQQILTFSRQRDLERKAAQLNIIIKEALKMLRASLPTTIEIRQNIDRDSGMVLADPTQIHQVLMNLCTNAAHAMREKGGVLEVSLSNKNLDTEAMTHFPEISPGAYLELTVSDTGHGIDPSLMDRIFDPYFTTKKLGEGTGLGLAVVHGIIKSYKGAINVQSEPGRGTTFHLCLPRIDPPKESEPSTELSTLPRGEERILFVDDEQALVQMGREMLAFLGYKVDSRKSSAEALETFREQANGFDLVVTDMTMPQMTGVELAREIKEIRPDIPIVLCTGYNELISEEKAKSMGIRDFIMKPLEIGRLATMVRKVLDGG